MDFDNVDVMPLIYIRSVAEKKQCKSDIIRIVVFSCRVIMYRNRYVGK